MPLNLLKVYNTLLDLIGMSEAERKDSLIGIFNRDIRYNEHFNFQGKTIYPTPIDGKIKMEILFTHLTTVMEDKKTRHRTFEIDRSCRLHWIKYHIEQKKNDNMLCFSVKEPEGLRTYIYDKEEKYVVILEPYKNKTAYYLLTAYHLTGKDAARDKMMRKYKRKENVII